LNIPFVDVVRDPTWSPDGRRIAFTCFLDNASADVCLINRDGSGFVRLTKDGSTKGDPAWSPDGSRIAFTKITAGSPPEIVLVASDGGGVTRLTDGFEAAWSPDGATLIFAGGDGLYTINVDGSQRTRLTTGGQTTPAWRP
jgi:TolB protein